MEIVDREAFTIVGLPVRATWRELWVDMPTVWRQFMARYTEIPDRYGNTFADVSLDKIGDQYLQLICARVTQVGRIPDRMTAIEIPAQRYVFHKHFGSVETIADSFGRMYDWAHEHGYRAGEFKVDMGYTPDGGELEHELYIALLPSQPWREAGSSV